MAGLRPGQSKALLTLAGVLWLGNSPESNGERDAAVNIQFNDSPAKFEREFGYDATYLREVVGTSISATVNFLVFQPMDHIRTAAQLAGALSEDCSPFSQLD